MRHASRSLGLVSAMVTFGGVAQAQGIFRGAERGPPAATRSRGPSAASSAGRSAPASGASTVPSVPAAIPAGPLRAAITLTGIGIATPTGITTTAASPTWPLARATALMPPALAHRSRTELPVRWAMSARAGVSTSHFNRAS